MTKCLIKNQSGSAEDGIRGGSWLRPSTADAQSDAEIETEKGILWSLQGRKEGLLRN